MRILLIENEADISRLIIYVLSRQGFTVEPAHDAVSAERLLAGGKFDAILLDLMLPGEDGYSFCTRLKSMERTRDIPVIIISARVMPNEVKRGMDCGASGYITKPYNPSTLGEEIRRIVAKEQGDAGKPKGA